MAVSGVSSSDFWSTVQTTGQTTTRGNKELGKDEFLMLLISQLKNQDPLDPLQNQDFIAQLAQFNTLEQMLNLNTEFANMINLQKFSQASGLIGTSISGMNEDQNLVEGLVGEILKKGDQVYLVMYGIRHNDDGSLTPVTSEQVPYDDVISLGETLTTMIGRPVTGITSDGLRVDGTVTQVKLRDDGIAVVVDGTLYDGENEVPVIDEEVLLEHLFWIGEAGS